MSPQFHIFYYNLFQTVHSAEGKPPAKWLELIVFDRFRSDFDAFNVVHELADEWLAPIDLARRQEAYLNHQNQSAFQDVSTP